MQSGEQSVFRILSPDESQSPAVLPPEQTGGAEQQRALRAGVSPLPDLLEMVSVQSSPPKLACRCALRPRTYRFHFFLSCNHFLDGCASARLETEFGAALSAASAMALFPQPGPALAPASERGRRREAWPEAGSCGAFH